LTGYRVPQGRTQIWRWVSSSSAHKLGPKQFGLSRSTPDALGVLNLVARALPEVDLDMAWRTNRQAIQRPDFCPGALQLDALASYTGQSNKPGQLELQIVVQPHQSLPSTRLLLTFMDYYGVGPAWTESISESIVAQTVLHIGSALLTQEGLSQEGAPFSMWQMIGGAWRKPGMVEFGPWWIELS